jgi:hypothetical protein
MKKSRLLVVALSVCLAAVFFSGTAYADAPLPEIIADFCEEVSVAAADTQEELIEARINAAGCGGGYADCRAGLFNNDPATCIVRYVDCGDEALEEATNSCSDFSEELGDAYADALRKARREGPGVERRFQKFIENQDACLQPAVDVAISCAGVD